MASIVLLLSELLRGESASVLAANRYMCGQSLGEFRPAVTGAPPCRRKQNESAAGAGRACTGREEDEKQQAKEESFEDLAVSRIAVDVMWP
ncbi:hypothetical protein PR202_gb26898 [Eleusine coracana subsp. coracana]|uniref:Secreted protein n=1 Tax=Eleusine coracana subsp. coracana TaxID=191504 RepID=A0AAV5FQB9_ELECO|nr:hypothetical protein QOZ80_1BG0052910 [Eleusine coracana subsp. coracana]GJN37899.1 hypothetical protein PR202_gb26898 [Eleusine coracana subsp. coracana]